MKKTTRNVLIGTIVSAVSIPIIINHLIFRQVHRKVKKELSEKNYYPWRFGNISYDVRGTGTPLLLVHGIGAGSSSYEWHRNVDQLAKHYKVYTLDLLGFGYSSKPKLTYTAFLYTQLIIDFIQNIIKEPTHIVASSLSSSFAIMACYQSPSLFRSLLLICPTGVTKNHTYPTPRDLWTRKLIELPVIGTSLYNVLSAKVSCERFLKEAIYNNPEFVSSQIIDMYYTCAHIGGASARYAIASFMTNHMCVDISTALRAITNSIFILWGEKAELTPLSDLENFKSLNPWIQSAIFPDTKLLPHGEKPFEFFHICHEFFQ